MSYRTKLVLESGDRRALDATVSELRTVAAAKGAEVAGPHTKPSRRVQIPLYKRLDGVERFGTWEYEIYTRELTVVGHDGAARAIASEAIPKSIAVTLTIDTVEQLRRNR